ncbi:MAG: NAD-dependent epimerase/dehydratase family protein [Caldilineaceae bacterium]|nr:NAD-dependent epimerase/dehydratase family protein [Caldilineaceae bacterium]MBP8109449.1 NAD-dependent epimerase/dehydratase family protein [Caldilineaceae bacterium]MBP8125723.1 NAD-dependent epimerase/dehydratase family protein [Caldilineaceae bacterium]MBP9071680.1 NAD-dependent epimerase/dehydratase family protein [Caldilineaceae bacterium]
MNILVTGAAGFIGSHIADVLIAAGHHVIIVDNLHTGHRHNVPAAATFYEADIRDGAALAAIFEKERIDAIAHEAALANVRESMTDPIAYAEVNIIGTLRLLELARKHGVKKFVFASTGGAVYGEGHRDDPADSPLPFTENFWPRPKDNYGASKLDMEFHIDLYYQNYGLKYTILRYPNVYGPRQDSKGEAGVVAIFAGAMLAGKPTKITGDGSQSRDFCFVGDIARANLLALESDSPDTVGIFNVGTDIPTTINQVHATLKSITGYAQEAAYVPFPTGEVVATYLNSSKAKAKLGWTAQVSLEEGLGQVVAWMKG